MKTIIFNDFFISTPYAKTLFCIKYTKANEIKPFVLKSQVMFLEAQKIKKKMQKKKSLAKKNKRQKKPAQKLPKSFLQT